MYFRAQSRYYLGTWSPRVKYWVLGPSGVLHPGRRGRPGLLRRGALPAPAEPGAESDSKRGRAADRRVHRSPCLKTVYTYIYIYVYVYIYMALFISYVVCIYLYIDGVYIYIGAYTYIYICIYVCLQLSRSDLNCH